ncbi:hypothetical protein B0H63DRAFT_531127 [Podospora didyma]|uniref:Rhamnogalacturonase A/B/Epimerase-like pectate lyase domain-containing protein n=1 Tax=Podospora didyma TaxID=330526 RepID=A0AAE0P4X5_9PEZI|nr:hypothetical protein B0H63DRAFT_531127 [Podospora didyma]
MNNLQRGVVLRGGSAGSKGNDTKRTSFSSASTHHHKRQSSKFWLSSLGPLGKQPHAGGGNYQFFRNVVEDFGADNSGETDTAEAPNAALASWNENLVGDSRTRCGERTTTAVGIFTENGSGGFVSDLEFNGGNIGWRAGSQQYTARSLVFNDCNTAAQMVWDWGWNWQRITLNGGSIGFNILGVGGSNGQGIGSVSIIDSTIRNAQVGVLTNSLVTSPNIVLDNTKFENVASTVKTTTGNTLLSGNLALWATGKWYIGQAGSTQTGAATAPGRGAGLDDANDHLYVRSRPQHEGHAASSFPVATTDGGCKNDATGDQASCINKFLRRAVDSKKVAYFPAGVYAILGSGFYSSDMKSPKVMVQVGNKGDVGKMEITDMLFSVRGATAGAVLMEWNVAAVTQGAAAMWDSHFRVGGALGTDLDLSKCPKFSNNAECIAASLLFRVTTQANGYFENVSTQISVFATRGTLIESKGLSWFYGGGSEHAVLYNYLFSGAKSVFMGHMQTESPYFQPKPGPPAPFRAGARFPNDPYFSHCDVTAEVWGDRCNYAWGLQIIDSKDIMLHSAGLYSFFNEYYQDCIPTHNCQDRILEVKGSTGVVIYNLFTVAAVNIASGIDSTRVPQEGNQRGFTTVVSVWAPLPGKDKYGGLRGTTIGGVETTIFVTMTTTVTIAVPSIVTNGIGYSNVNVSMSGAMPITIFPSIEIPPVVITLLNGAGGSTARTVVLPPWPQIEGGPSVVYMDPATLPSVPRLTIGYDRQLTTESEPECETQTTEACTTTNFLSAGTIMSSTTLCETVKGCSISVSDSTTDVVGTQTAAPVGTWGDERWATQTLGAAFTSSVYAAIGSRLAREEASQGGTILSFTLARHGGPTCRGASTACGGTVCAGYWCDPTPVGKPPGYQDPKDPSSDAYVASTRTIGDSSSTTTPNNLGSTPTTPLTRGPINCFNEADFSGHADIQSGDQDAFLNSFSELRGGDLLGPNDEAVTFGPPTRMASTMSSRAAGCPVREDYTKCSNGGVGGSCQVGCLLCTFQGGRGNPPSDPCADFDCGGCGTPGDPPTCQQCCS